MKLKFDSKLAFQWEAIQSITDIFEGQEACRTNFSVTKPTISQDQFTILDEKIGVGNKLVLLDDEIIENTHKIQLRNGLKQHKFTGRDFSVEMETGTGKTYVYLRSIFELNKRFGFTKFIIVVPSIAIKEGVNKSLQITREHFKELYDNVTYDFFTYDSQKLEQVRSFATNDYIQIMVINIDAFRRSFTDPEKETKANIIHRYHDKLGYPPIKLIQDTNPILIIDEPQSVDTTPKSKEAIASLNPLCTFRYSATHKEKYNLMYKLDSVDAYEKKLVKQIEVASLAVQNYHNKPYIRLISVNNKTYPITARVELDLNKNGKIQRTVKTVKQNDDLMEITNRQLYEGYIIKDIYCDPENEYIDFTSQPEYVRLGHSIGTVDDDVFKRMQINKTIKEHLDKELILNPQNIKVLSLFFIDKVSNYRLYDEDGNDVGGKFAHMFEQEYRKLIVSPRYQTLFKEIRDLDVHVSQIHNGYFSIDKKGKITDTRGDTKADDDTYNLIMKDKEKLLSFESNLRFIFSHSALKEGWDNPNVFQICTLNETSSEMKKRQEIGRGLRLAVNQDGERIQGFDVNTLTVMANESYEDFVHKLQKEIEAEEGIRFGYLDDHSFANIVIGLEGDKQEYLGQQKSEELWNFFFMKGYVDEKGKVQDNLRIDLKDNKVDIPDEFDPVKGQVTSTLRKVAGNINVKNADDKKKINVNKGVFLSPAFKELWNRIKYKTIYSVKFDTDKLIEKCAKDIRVNLIAGKGKFIYKKAITEISRGGAVAKEHHDSTSLIDTHIHDLPDIVSYLQNETNLTRKSIVEILIKSQRLDTFKNNPQKFIDETINIIRTQMRHFIVDGIKYERIGEHDVYKQELFENEELFGHLKHDMIKSSKSPYNYVVYDSAVEKSMAEEFEKSDNIKVYSKLPGWFTIDTPLGSYNPDWAILWENEGIQKLFFVIETKGAISWEFLRPVEKGKIECGKKHFQTLGDDITLEVADSFDNLRDVVLRG